MELFETAEVMGHEQVLFCHDRDAKLKAIIALHDTNLGPAMGATRLWSYNTEEDALRDALRLSRGMTYKAACANIPVGGGKAVIIASPEHKTDRLLHAYGRFIESLQGRFITGQDVNISPQDVRKIRQQTSYVVGTAEHSGGPAPVTALGVLLSIKAAVQYRLERSDLQGLKVAVQGLGNVGKMLCHNLQPHGVKLFVSDVRPERAAEVAALYDAEVIAPDEIHMLPVDVYSPCALGGILNDKTIPQIHAQIIAGAANNQLENEAWHSQLLRSQDILYCPDYVVNAGGLINVYNEMIGYDERNVLQQLHNIYDTLWEIFQRADRDHMTTYDAAQKLAEERIQIVKQSRTKE